MDQLPAEVVAALDEGRLVDAIKLLRNCTGLDLKASKDLLDAYKAGHPIRVPAVRSPVKLPAEAIVQIQAGRKIEAIKIVRERTGLGLKEAKDLVDAWGESSANLPGADLNRVEDSAGNRWLLLLLVSLAGIGVVAYLWLRG